MPETKTLQEATKDDLLSVLDSCERMYWSRFHHDASPNEWSALMKQKEDTVAELKNRFGLDDNGIREAWQEWNERILRQEYEESYCSKCPRTSGFEFFKSLGGCMSCSDGSISAMVYRLPKTKEECILNELSTKGKP